MKEIKCVAVTEYKKCPIAILQVDCAFIRLFVFRGQFYYMSSYFNKFYLHRLAHFLNLKKFPFPAEEMTKMKSVILNETFKQIDELLTKKQK